MTPGEAIKIFDNYRDYVNDGSKVTIHYDQVKTMVEAYGVLEKIIDELKKDIIISVKSWEKSNSENKSSKNAIRRTRVNQYNINKKMFTGNIFSRLKEYHHQKIIFKKLNNL